LKRKAGEKRMEWRMALEGVEKELAAPLELFDTVMKQVEAMAKELKKISRGIWHWWKGSES
jgi:hypothetical protein